MKKLFNCSVLFIGICILFTSCSRLSSVSVVKRQYRNGYYVSIGADKPAEMPKQVVAPEIKVKKNTSATLAELAPAADVIPAGPIAAKTSIVKQPQTADKITEKGKLHRVLKRLPEAGTQMAAAVKVPRLSPGIKSNSAEHDIGYILYVIVVVLVVLWALSLVGGGWGLGGLVHLLLVIALLLLLFRLLGVL